MILGAILAGGESRRFGGDKALALLEGRPLLAHVAGHLAEVAARVVVCGRDWPGLVSIPDRPEPGLGPLGGLAAALAYGAEHGFARVITAPCDTPRLDAEMLSALATVEGPAILGDMPVLGSWPTTLAADLRDHLAATGDRSVRGWAARAGAVFLALPPPPNINRAADLAQLDQRTTSRV